MDLKYWELLIRAQIDKDALKNRFNGEKLWLWKIN